MITQWLLDVEFLEEMDFDSYSIEYVREGNKSKLNLLFPFCTVQVTTRWE